MCECSGHSGGETPVPIPNTADKPSHVPYCTEVREPLGTLDRCYAHSTFYFSFLYCQISLLSINLSGVLGKKTIL